MSNEAMTRLPAFLVRKEDGTGEIVRTADVCSLARFKQPARSERRAVWGIAFATDKGAFEWRYHSKESRDAEWKRLGDMLGQPANVGD